MGACTSKKSIPEIIEDEIEHSRHRAYSFHENLVRERTGRHRFELIYEVLDEIGHGGLCTIYKIRKREESIGGSARMVTVVKRNSFGRLLPEGFKREVESKEKKIHANKEVLFALKVINLALVQVRKLHFRARPFPFLCFVRFCYSPFFCV